MTNPIRNPPSLWPSESDKSFLAFSQIKCTNPCLCTNTSTYSRPFLLILLSGFFTQAHSFYGLKVSRTVVCVSLTGACQVQFCRMTNSTFWALVIWMMQRGRVFVFECRTYQISQTAYWLDEILNQQIICILDLKKVEGKREFRGSISAKILGLLYGFRLCFVFLDFNVISQFLLWETY